VDFVMIKFEWAEICLDVKMKDIIFR